MLTDGSKHQGAIATAAVSHDYKLTLIFQNQSSIFVVESHALFLTLECIENLDQTHFVVYSDACSRNAEC